jgi:hypothetical protein
VPLAIRSGGHTIHSTVDGGVVLDLRDLAEVEIDREAGTAWAQTGLTAAAYTTAVGAHGLATGFGDTGSVGLGGITLGGGIGYLARKHGLTIDSLLAADIVTADGELRRADASTNPDLFWAIRGGGGNFGVATRFKFQLKPVDRIVGGMLMLPATAEIVQQFVAAAEAAPEELTAIANVMTAPPAPFVPAEHHGKLVVLALMCYAGDAQAGQQCLDAFRALATPIADMLKPMAYPEIYPPDDASYHPTAVGKTMFIDRVDRPTATRSWTSCRSPTRRSASRRSVCSAAPWHASRRRQPHTRIASAGSWSTSQRFMPARPTSRSGRPGSTTSRPGSTRGSTAPT